MSDLDDFDDLAEFDPDYEVGTPMTAEADLDDEDFDDLAEFDAEEEEDEPEPEVEEAPAKPVKVQQLGSDRQTRKPASFIVFPATKTSEAIRQGHMTGHCAFPQSAHPEESHARCKGWNRANPDKVFSPCPCRHHFPDEEFECGNCGATIVAAPHWPADEDGDTRYVHLDHKRGRVLLADECPR